MKYIFNNLKNFLEQNEERIVEDIIKSIVQNRPDLFSNLPMDDQSNVFRQQIQQFVLLLGMNAAGDSKEEEIEKWGKKVSQEKVRLGLTLYESIENFNIIRKVTWEVVEEFSDVQPEMNAKQILHLGQFINEFIDSIIMTFTQSYTSLANKRLREQQEVIDELSTPVISIVDGVAVLPIIGDIDTHRAKILMEHALNETNRQNVECLIIDLSGVFVVDTMVAQELFKIIASLELTGVDVNITGIRPELAHSVVTLGINFENVQLFNNLGQALKAFGIIRKA